MKLEKIIKGLADKEFPFQIKIECEGKESFEIEVFTELQDQLKTRTESDIIKILRSIRDYGFSFPFFYVFLKNKRYVLDGHGRMKALKLFKECGGIVPQLPAVRIHAKTMDEAKQKLLRLNSQYGVIDLDGLKDFVDGLDVSCDDLELPNISVDDLEALFEDHETEADDDLPEKVSEISKLGDLWELNGHRVLCGDSTDAEQIERLTAGQKADMVFTDPPYGVAIGDKNKLLDSIQKAGRIKNNIKNDTLSPEALKSVLVECFKNIKIYSNDCCSYYVTAPQGGELGMMMMMMMKDAGLPIKHIIIWVKNRQCFSFGRLDYEYKHEPILYTWNKRHKYYGKGKHKSSVWEIDKEIKCDLHPTMKPVELIINAILNSSTANMIITDPFLGSGSTLIACEKTDRICYGMEIEPHYVDVIVRRWVDWCRQNDRKILLKLNGKKFTNLCQN